MVKQSAKIQQNDSHSTITQVVPISGEILQEQKKMCRICLSSEKQQNNELIVPCRCSGSLAYVHRNCYFLWIKHRYARLQSSEQKQKMENQGFDCQICTTHIKVQFEFQRSLVTLEELGYICKTSIPLTITIIIFFMIAIGAFSYLVYFADLTRQQFDKQNVSQALFTVIGILIVVVFFGAGLFFFITRYVWIQKLKILGLESGQIQN